MVSTVWRPPPDVAHLPLLQPSTFLLPAKAGPAPQGLARSPAHMYSVTGALLTVWAAAGMLVSLP